jgi:hypothetical protein
MNLNKIRLSWVRLVVLFAFGLFPLVTVSSAHGQGCPGGCDDGDPCTIDTCNAGVCIHTIAAGYSCADDGNPCTFDQCDNTGACVHPPKTGYSCADDGNPCTFDQCDSSGACSHPPKTGYSCADDGNPCTDDRCDSSGACVHTPLNGRSCSDDFNECTLDICVNGECQHQPQIKACDDYNKCTEPDMCTNGLCIGVPKDCSFLDQEPCIAGACNPSTGECEEKDICRDECTWDIEMDLDVDGTDLSIFIRGGSLLDLPIFAPNFGRTNCPLPMMR